MGGLAHHLPAMRDRYSRWVELGNKGAREMGFSDLGAMWRAGYDMTPTSSALTSNGCGNR